MDCQQARNYVRKTVNTDRVCSENAAIEHGVSPAVWTKDNINKMKEQLGELGCIFDWDRELATCDPQYYR